MAPDQQGLPPYRRIANEIIGKIRRGELRPGDEVPSVAKMMEDEGVSRATAARVTSVLSSEGWVTAAPGTRTRVAERKKITPGADRLRMLRTGGTGLAEHEQVEFLDAERLPAPAQVAAALAVEEGAETARRRRRYLDSEGVIVVSATWVSRPTVEAAPEFLRPEPLPKMTFGLIEERTGRRANKQRDEVSVQPAPDDVAEHLGVEAGTPVLTMVNHYWDQDGEPTEYAVDYYAPGRKLCAEYDLEA